MTKKLSPKRIQKKKTSGSEARPSPRGSSSDLGRTAGGNKKVFVEKCFELILRKVRSQGSRIWCFDVSHRFTPWSKIFFSDISLGSFGSSRYGLLGCSKDLRADHFCFRWVLKSPSPSFSRTSQAL